LLIDNISVVIITLNSEETLKKSLDSVQNFKEVIIYDTGSTDKTISIATSYSNVKLFRGEFVGFGETKNRAISCASNLWILSLDSDEYIDENLFQEIKNISLNRSTAYSIKRENYVLGKRMRWGGLGGDWLVRLFNREDFSFKTLPVHEYIDVKNREIYRLKNPFYHIAVTDVSQFLIKIARYSKLGEKRKRYPILIIVLKSLFAFLRTYIFKLGFLDGWRGLLVAVSNSNGRFYKYIRSYTNV